MGKGDKSEIVTKSEKKNDRKGKGKAKEKEIELWGEWEAGIYSLLLNELTLKTSKLLALQLIYFYFFTSFGLIKM